MAEVDLNRQAVRLNAQGFVVLYPAFQDEQARQGPSVVYGVLALTSPGRLTIVEMSRVVQRCPAKQCPQLNHSAENAGTGRYSMPPTPRRARCGTAAEARRI